MCGPVFWKLKRCHCGFPSYCFLTDSKWSESLQDFPIFFFLMFFPSFVFLFFFFQCLSKISHMLWNHFPNLYFLWTPSRQATFSLGTGDSLPNQHKLNSKADCSLWFGRLYRWKRSLTILGKERFHRMTVVLLIQAQDSRASKIGETQDFFFFCLPSSMVTAVKLLPDLTNECTHSWWHPTFKCLLVFLFVCKCMCTWMQLYVDIAHTRRSEVGFLSHSPVVPGTELKS